MATMTSPGRSPPIAAGLPDSTELTRAPAGSVDGATGDAGDEVVVAVRVGAGVTAPSSLPATPSHPGSTTPDETSWRATPRTSSAGRKTDRVEAPDCVTCSRMPETLPLRSRSGHPMSSAVRGVATAVPAKPEVRPPPSRGRPDESTVPAYSLDCGAPACDPGSMATARTAAPTEGSFSSKVAAGRSSAIRTTASPEVWSTPTISAGCRDPFGSTTVIVLASTRAREGVTMMPPDSATSPEATDLPVCFTMMRATVEGPLVASIARSAELARWFIPGSRYGPCRCRLRRVAPQAVLGRDPSSQPVGILGPTVARIFPRSPMILSIHGLEVTDHGGHLGVAPLRGTAGRSAERLSFAAPDIVALR